MPTTNPVPSQDPSDLLFNAGKLDEVVSGSNATYTDRLGISRRTMAGIDAAADVVLGGLGYAPPVAYASGIALTLTTQTVEYAGEVYAPKIANLPFTTTTWAADSAKFRLIQGVAATDLAASGGAAMIGYMPAGTGAVATTVQSKLGEMVSVFDFLPAQQIAYIQAGNTAMQDSAVVTAAFTAAQTASDFIKIPPGTYLLDQFKQQNRKVFIGAGLNNTFIKQANPNRPAWWVVAKSGVYTTQIIGAQLKGVWFLGAGALVTVASMIVEAVAPYTVQYCEFDIGGSGGYHTLEVISATANPVYSNRFKVIQQDPDNRSGGIGSYNTGVVCGSGVYNEWYINVVGAQNGIAMTDSSFNCLFHHVITDGQQQYNGQANVIVNATVEAWTGTAQLGAISNPGYNNRFISITLTNVPNASVGGYGVYLNSESATIVTILGYKIYGSYPGGAPMRPILFGTSNSGFIADAETSACPNKIENYTTYDQLKNFTFAGDSTGLTSLAKKFSADVVFVTASTYTLDSGFSTSGQLDETIYLNSSANCTITLPSASSFIGRKIYVCSRVAFSLSSASANVLPMAGSPTPNILAATVGKWAILQAGSNGFWNVIANN